MVKPMGIYLLTAKDDAPMPAYEVNKAMVVIAHSAPAARRLAADAVIDESPSVWLGPGWSYCTLIGDCVGVQSPHVVVRENNAS